VSQDLYLRTGTKVVWYFPYGTGLLLCWIKAIVFELVKRISGFGITNFSEMTIWRQVSTKSDEDSGILRLYRNARLCLSPFPTKTPASR
jgi:hypothetical protein